MAKERTGASVRKGDSVRIGKDTVKVTNVRRDPDGRTNVTYEGKGVGGQTSYGQSERVR